MQKEAIFILARIIITWVVIFFVSLFAYKEVLMLIGKIKLEEIEVPRNGIIVVDKKNYQEFSNGSPEHPFKTINEGLEFYLENQNFSKILVYPGEYEEKLVIPKNLQLAGVGEGVKITNPKRSGKTIEISESCQISNLSVIGGKFGIYIAAETVGDVVLNQIHISNASEWGVSNEESPELSLKIIGSEIFKNENQGLYLRKSNFYINNSKVYENMEEGIDLHIDMSSTIKNTDIFSNGEGGIETELGNIALEIEGCEIYNNGSSGVNLQSFEGDSSVSIKNNTIFKNTDFGIRCAIHAPFVSPYFSKALQTLENNEISENGDLAIDMNCRR